jgi:hypothetical protein
MKPDMNNPIEWDSVWRKTKSYSFKAGDIFQLDLYGTRESNGVYRIQKDWNINLPERDHRILIDCLIGEHWQYDHSWQLSSPVSQCKMWIHNKSPIVNAAKPVITNISDWRAWAHNVPGNCPCGIARARCEYH